MIAGSRAENEDTGTRILAGDRAEHGRQVHLPAPERADRRAGPDGHASCRRSARHIGVVDRLFSRVGAADDLARGRSTFMVEMVETAAILNQATPRSLVILDEIGRGTATFDGLSIAWAAIEHLHEVNRCRALFATHYHELTALAERLPPRRQRHGRGQGVARRDRVPLSRGAGRRRPLLRHPCGEARRACPAPLLARANEVLTELEKADVQAEALRSARPICPCSAPPKVYHPTRSPTAVRARQPLLPRLSPDAMTPLEALEARFTRLKGLLDRTTDP